MPDEMGNTSFYSLHTDNNFLPPTINIFHHNGIEHLYCCLCQGFFISYSVLFTCCLLRCVEIVGETASDQQRMKVFSVLALSKQ